MIRGVIKSNTEQYCLDKLKQAGLFEGYENETFMLIEGFYFDNDYWARTENGKGEFKNRGDHKIRSATYTPDFVGKDYIIEVKGFVRNASAFTVKFKLFKAWLKKNKIGKTLFVPRNKKEIDQTIEIILANRSKQ